VNQQKLCQHLIDAYPEWLRKGFSIEHLVNVYKITTPFLDRHNDCLQVYALKEIKRIILSDDGYTVADLRTSGLDLSTPKQKAVLQTILNGYGVKMNRERLYVEASYRNIGQKMHSLIQAMLSVNNMFIMVQNGEE